MTPRAVKAINFILENEGGFSFNKNDKGGATNWGLTLRFIQSCFSDTKVTVDFIKKLSRAKAIEIYNDFLWKKCPFLEKINDEEVAIYIFDMIVNHGEKNAIELAQHAILSAFSFQKELKIDGLLGEKTLDLINSIMPIQNYHNALQKERIAYYKELVMIRPQNKIFLNGWLKRANRWPQLKT